MAEFRQVYDITSGENPDEIDLPAGSYVKLEYEFPIYLSTEVIRAVYCGQLGKWVEYEGHRMLIDGVEVDDIRGVLTVNGRIGGSPLVIIAVLALIALSVWGLVGMLQKAHVLAEDVSHNPAVAVGGIGAILLALCVVGIVIALLWKRKT